MRPRQIGGMPNHVAILLGAALIAAAIAVTGRWEIALVQGATIRLDRWTGEVVICAPDARTMPKDTIVGTKVACEAK